jgi:hypothetical protein
MIKSRPPSLCTDLRRWASTANRPKLATQTEAPQRGQRAATSRSMAQNNSNPARQNRAGGPALSGGRQANPVPQPCYGPATHPGALPANQGGAKELPERPPPHAPGGARTTCYGPTAQLAEWGQN